MSVENDLVFLDGSQKKQESQEKKLQTKGLKKKLDLKQLKSLIEKGLYRPDSEDIAQAFLDDELGKKA